MGCSFDSCSCRLLFSHQLEPPLCNVWPRNRSLSVPGDEDDEESEKEETGAKEPDVKAVLRCV